MEPLELKFNAHKTRFMRVKLMKTDVLKKKGSTVALRTEKFKKSQYIQLTQGMGPNHV